MITSVSPQLLWQDIVNTTYLASLQNFGVQFLMCGGLIDYAISKSYCSNDWNLHQSILFTSGLFHAHDIIKIGLHEVFWVFHSLHVALPVCIKHTWQNTNYHCWWAGFLLHGLLVVDSQLNITFVSCAMLKILNCIWRDKSIFENFRPWNNTFKRQSATYGFWNRGLSAYTIN